MIRFWINLKLDSLDLYSALACSFGHAMHAVHNSSTRGEDYRIGRIRGVDQFHMLDQRAPCSGLIVASPWIVQLSNRSQRDRFARQTTREFHETVDIPGQEPAIRWPKVILLAHVRSRCGDDFDGLDNTGN